MEDHRAKFLLGKRRAGKRLSSCARLRNEMGMQLVELVIALGVASILGTAVANSLSQMTRLGTACQNQVLAAYNLIRIRNLAMA